MSGYKNVKYKFEDEEKKIHEQSFEINAFDTQGLSDSEGRSEEFLNEIAQTIKTTPLNLIVVLVEYGRMDTGLYRNLAVLSECLNGMSQSSCMLIVNKVPTLKSLERKLKRGENFHDRKETLEEYFNEVSKVLNILFKYKCFLEDDSLEGAEQFNTNVYNFIRGILFTRSFHLDASKVRTWNEIKEFYEKEISELENEQTNDQSANVECEIEKNLNDLDLERSELKNKSGKCLDSVESKVRKLKEKKANLNNLEAALVNKHQQHANQ